MSKNSEHIKLLTVALKAAGGLMVTTPTQRKEIGRIADAGIETCMPVADMELSSEQEVMIDYVVCRPVNDTPKDHPLWEFEPEKNVIDVCSKCGQKIVYRKHAPKAKKICVPCALQMAKDDELTENKQ